MTTLIANDETQQKVCVGPICKCNGVETECACRQITDGKYDETLSRCSDCGAKLKVIDLETGEDV